ncbi:MAG: hypothetical protein ABL962_19360 [Fimbriimonadaceae bacterium]
MNLKLLALVPGFVEVNRLMHDFEGTPGLSFATRDEEADLRANAEVLWEGRSLRVTLCEPDEAEVTAVMSDGQLLLIAEHAVIAWKSGGSVSRIVTCCMPVTDVRLSEDLKLVAVLAEIDLYVVDVAKSEVVLEKNLSDVSWILSFGTRDLKLQLFDGSELSITV